MDNLLDVCWVKEAGHKRVHNIWSHSSEVLEQVKLLYGEKESEK